MAGSGEETVEYESDPEEAKRSLTMRRREASDDEEEEGEGDKIGRKINSRAVIASDGESDCQGAPAEYDDEEEELEDEEEELDKDEEEEEELIVEEEYDARGSENTGDVVEIVGKKEFEEEDRDGFVGELAEAEGANEVEEEEGEKKENEPFAVPTAGAFYMHDDRFRGNARGRNRRTFVGKQLWESKDDKKWGHDMFEEITVQELHYEEGTRNFRGRYRARERNRGADRGYPSGGNKSKAYNANNQNQGPKSVRGRGPRRYDPSRKNYSRVSPMPRQHKPGKPIEKTLHDSSARAAMASSNSESEPASFTKQLFASSLNSASPPFYPSSSSSKEPSLKQKTDEKTINRNLPSTNTIPRGKNVVGSTGMEKLNINDSSSPLGGKPSSSSQLQISQSLVNTTLPLQSRAQGRGVAPHNQVNRASPPMQTHYVQRNPVQTRAQPSLQSSVQQLGQSSGSGSQTLSPPKASSSINSFQPAEVGSPSESGKYNTALMGKGRGSVQGSGRGSFMYGGTQVIGASGNMGSGHGDPNFAFLPVMPFGGQNPGGMGLPAVGMAFPGYVGHPQLGMGNSEMTWLPVLAGAAGALGAAYCSPYLAVDGSYQSRVSGQTSSSGASSKENNSNKPNNDWKPSQIPEAASDEFGQRQKNTRRYTEMNFGQ